MTTKEVPLIGAGFHAFIDLLFWYLPFANVKQGNSLVEELDDLTEDDWSIKREEIRDEHSLIALPTIFASAGRHGLGTTGQTRVASPRGSSVLPKGSGPLCMTMIELP